MNTVGGKRILLTGATGGIGYPLAKLLAAKGARLALVDRNSERLREVCDEIGRESINITLDLGLPQAAETAVAKTCAAFGGMDILINNAGIMDFTLFHQQNPARIAQIMNINAVTPMLLTRAALPHMLAQGAGRIVNIGSTFGSIGFPHYAVYSASKFAARGFSEALRRELEDSGVEVTYVAPRAIKTPLNDAASVRMMEANKIAMDDPAEIAQIIVRAIEHGRKDVYIGGSEPIFARLNGILPRLVDFGLKQKTRAAHRFADRGAFNEV
ncbi:MAG: SDR family oxidoreductase [Methylobacillus sp.]|jgi:short-subunit dehydrogenase|nr:SDR family oxidoreductase [Methylobacillus sp.]